MPTEYFNNPNEGGRQESRAVADPNANYTGKTGINTGLSGVQDASDPEPQLKDYQAQYGLGGAAAKWKADHDAWLARQQAKTAGKPSSIQGVPAARPSPSPAQAAPGASPTPLANMLMDMKGANPQMAMAQPQPTTPQPFNQIDPVALYMLMQRMTGGQGQG